MAVKVMKRIPIIKTDFVVCEKILCDVSMKRETILGALTHYISFEGHTSFQPINSNWGILAEMEMDKKTRKNKKLKNELLANRAIETIKKFIELNSK